MYQCKTRYYTLHVLKMHTVILASVNKPYLTYKVTCLIAHSALTTLMCSWLMAPNTDIVCIEIIYTPISCV